MASAALASQNESSWPQSGGGYMGKIPSYINPNPKKKHKQFHAVTNARKNNDETPPVTQTASDDAYSFNNFNGVPAINGLNLGGYNTFNISSYNKIELEDLRKRFASELDQVRSLRDRIDSGQLSSTNTIQKPSKKLAASNKNMKKLPNMDGLMKECRQILTKLMKDKEGWVFNVPVDDVALGLHDYHQIVKRPMDLETVKSNFGKKLYLSPVEFAEDVRLTFNNALLYNPKNDPVHGMAERLLVRFEELFKPIGDKIDSFHGGNDDVEGGSRNYIKKPKAKAKASPSPSPVVNAPPQRTAPLKKLDRLENRSHSSASTPSHPPPMPAQSPMKTPSPSPSKSQTAVNLQISGRVGKTKLPKPRAKDPDKREMNIEEKHKLGVGLQSLPQEKMPQLVQIIRKRNEHLAQDGDEIELDIEALDTETLWELDRFVTNWKKLVSKTKRQSLLMNLNPGIGGVPAPSTSAADTDAGADLSEKNDYVKRPKKGDDLDEYDVDIEDDMPVTSFAPVEIEKDEAGGSGGGEHEENGNAGSGDSSSSSSSGSDSSSSSDSDSGSSSGSDSDEDEAQS